MSLWLKLKKTKKNRYLSYQTPAPAVDLPLFAPENFELITQAVEDKKAIGQMIPESRQEHESFHEEMMLKAHEAANNIGLSKRVFAARLQGLEAILTVRLAALAKTPETQQARDLLRRRLQILYERTADLAASYRAEIDCYLHVGAFLYWLAEHQDLPEAALVYDSLIREGDPKRAEAFLNSLMHTTSAHGTEAAYYSGWLAELRIDPSLALDRYIIALQGAPQNLDFLCRTGMTARNLGRYQEAVECLEWRARVIQGQRNHDEVMLALAQRELAYTHLQEKQYEKAEPLYQNAMTLLAQKLGHSNQELAICWLQLGEMQETLGAYDKAQLLYGRAFDMLKANMGGLDPLLAPALERLAGLMLDMGLHEEALPLYQQLVAVREGSMPSGHPFLFHAMAKVTETYRFLGAYANAEEICRKNLKLMETYYAKGHPQTAERLRELSKLCVLQGKNEEGRQYLDKATALLALQ